MSEAFTADNICVGCKDTLSHISDMDYWPSTWRCKSSGSRVNVRATVENWNGGAVCAGLICWGAYGLLSATGPAMPSRTLLSTSDRLVVDRTSLERIPTIGFVSRHFTVSNESTESITITGVTTECSCTSITPIAFALGPGDSQRVDLSINGSAYRGRRNAKIKTRVQFQIGEEAESFEFEAAVYDPVHYSPPRIPAEITLGSSPVSTPWRVETDPAVSELNVTVPSQVCSLTETANDSSSTTWEVRFKTIESLPSLRLPVKFTMQIEGREFDWSDEFQYPVESDIRYSPPMILVRPESGHPTAQFSVWSESGEPISEANLGTSLHGLGLEWTVADDGSKKVFTIHPSSGAGDRTGDRFATVVAAGMSPVVKERFRIAVPVVVKWLPVNGVRSKEAR